MSLLCISRKEKTKQIVVMGRKLSVLYVDIQSDVPKGKFILKITVQNFGRPSTYFCGGHKNNLRLKFRSSFKEKKVPEYITGDIDISPDDSNE